MRTIFLFISIFILFPLVLLSQEKEETNPALLIIDIQEFYFPEGFNPLVKTEKASQQAGRLLTHFRDNNNLVVHIKHASSKDSLIHYNVQPTDNEIVITKHHVSSYRDTKLLDYLKQHNINQVVICGMMTHMCVEAAARTSDDFGFNVILIGDACATRDIIYKNDTVKAADVHASTLGTIDRYYGRVMTTDEYLNP